MKKFFYSFLFALLMPLLVFTGCGGGPAKFTASFYVDGSLYTTVEFESQKPYNLPEGPEKEGFFLQGWQDNHGMLHSANSQYFGGESNVSFNAVYKPTALQLTYNNIDGVQIDAFGDLFNITLPEGIESFDLAQYFNMSSDATWDIQSINSSYIQAEGTFVTLHQSNGNITIIGTYQEHTLTYYISVMNPYILPRYTLTFEGIDDPVYVRQGQTLDPAEIPDLPEHYDEDYIAASWDFDFSTPIYSDQYIGYTTEQKYKHVKYYVDGELVYTSEELTYGDATTPIDRNSFTKAHYYTELWNTKPDFSGSTVAYDFNFDADYHALYLEFRPIEYAVYFNNYAGSTTEDGEVFSALYFNIETDPSELVFPTLKKDYYNFIGYADAEGTPYTAFPMERIGELNEIDVIWDPIKYNITYNLNGGTNSDQNPAYLTYETSQFLADPSKSYYSFAGWYGTPECDSTEIEYILSGSHEELTLYAKWEIINYRASYIYPYSQYAENKDSLKQYVNAEDTALVNLVQTGHTFNTYTNESGESIVSLKNGVLYINPSHFDTATPMNFGNGPEPTVRIYADMTPIQYPVNYTSSNTLGNNPNSATYTIRDGLTLTKPTADGYEFVNFTDSSNDVITEIPSGLTGPITVNLNWDLIEYDLIFVSANPDIEFTLSSAYDTYNIESNFEMTDIEFSKLTRGYDIKALYADSEKTQEITGITPGYTGDRTIYIDFKIATYTLKYHNTQGYPLYRNGEWITGDYTTTFTYFDEVKTEIGFLYKEFYGVSYKVLTPIYEYEDSDWFEIPNQNYSSGNTVNSWATDVVVEPVFDFALTIDDDGYITDFVSYSSFADFIKSTELDQLTFPAAFDSKKIKGITGSFLFEAPCVNKIIFPEGYTTIDPSFSQFETGATEIVLPSTLTTLSNSFLTATYCPNLTICDVSKTKLTDWNSTLPTTVQTIVLPSTLLTFVDKYDRTYTFPQGLTSLTLSGSYASNKTLDLTHLINLTTLKMSCTYNTLKLNPKSPIKTINYPYSSPIGKIEIPSSTTEINASFRVAALEVVVGDNVNINVSREKLTKLTVGDNCNISIIGSYGYDINCLTHIEFGQNSKIVNIDTMNNIALDALPTNKIVVSDTVTSLGEYAFADVKDFSSIFEFEDFSAITSIGAYAFYNATGVPSDFSALTSLTTLNANTFQNTSFIDGVNAEFILPEGITSIGRYALSNLNIKKLYIPSSVEVIGDYALSGSTFDELFAPFMKKDQVGHFYNATIKRFTLLEGETTMYESTDLYTFTFNSGLEYVCLPSTLTEIPARIFSGQTSLTEVVIINTANNPSQLTAIGDNAFENCIALQSITLPNTVTTIYSYAFSGCNNLSQVNMPTSLTTIQNCAFAGCGLTEVIIPTSVRTIGSGAFASCPITFAYIPKEVASVNGFIFENAPSNIVIATNHTSAATIPNTWSQYFNLIAQAPATYATVSYNYDITQRQAA